MIFTPNIQNVLYVANWCEKRQILRTHFILFDGVFLFCLPHQLCHLIITLFIVWNGFKCTQNNLVVHRHHNYYRCYFILINFLLSKWTFVDKHKSSCILFPWRRELYLRCVPLLPCRQFAFDLYRHTDVLPCLCHFRHYSGPIECVARHLTRHCRRVEY